jgi:hypothetical protein
MWQYALWGLVGAAVNRALLFLEASQRVKGWPWAQPDGPGGGVYAVSVVLHLAIAATTTAAVSTTALLSNGFLAFGMGAAAPVVVKKVSGYALKVLPPDDSSQSADQGGADDGS